MMKEIRQIKKYSNRRLYDTAQSCCITLSDVRDLVLDQQEFQVVDAKTGEDLTRSVLLQIFLEEENGSAPMLSNALLARMIRFYGDSMQGFMGRYLENNVEAFSQMQAWFHDQAKTMSGDKSPVPSEMWLRFLDLQGNALQSMLKHDMDQCQRLFSQMQDVDAESFISGK